MAEKHALSALKAEVRLDKIVKIHRRTYAEDTMAGATRRRSSLHFDEPSQHPGSRTKVPGRSPSGRLAVVWRAPTVPQVISWLRC